MRTKAACVTSKLQWALSVPAPRAPCAPGGGVLLPESATSHPCASLSFQEYMKGAFCLGVFVSRGFLSKSAARRFPAPPAPPPPPNPTNAGSESTCTGRRDGHAATLTVSGPSLRNPDLPDLRCAAKHRRRSQVERDADGPPFY